MRIALSVLLKVGGGREGGGKHLSLIQSIEINRSKKVGKTIHLANKYLFVKKENKNDIERSEQNGK